MDHIQQIVIVGAGQTGYWAARTLREQGFAGGVILLGDETHLPYERPPLSKAVLADKTLAASTHLTTAATLLEQDIDWRPGSHVSAIDRAAQTITVDGVGNIAYDRLILATGGRSRPVNLPGIGANPVYYLRSIGDALALHDALDRELPLLIIGGGWIGLEIAASARKRNLPVTVVEAAAHLCARALPAQASTVLEKLHSDAGVDLHLGCSVSMIEGEAAAAQARLSDGRVVAAATIVVGIGMIPNAELAEEAGLGVDNGVLVDANGRTSDPHIFAAGDAARFPSPREAVAIRLESWSHAQNHGIAVAKAILGETTPYDPIPWFWSDQYDLNLQMVGILASDDILVVRGSPTALDGTMFFLRDDNLTAAISFNRGRENGIARRLIKQGVPIAPQVLANEDEDLRAFLG